MTSSNLRRSIRTTSLSGSESMSAGRAPHTTFFADHGFQVIEGQAVPPDVYAEVVRSYDEGVAEFLDLERVKPNTLGNTRMLLTL